MLRSEYIESYLRNSLQTAQYAMDKLQFVVVIRTGLGMMIRTVSTNFTSTSSPLI